MTSHGVTFRFERRGRWDVLSGQIRLAELSVHSDNGTNPGERWRLRAVGSETPAEACWPAHPGAGRSYRLPERTESHAISLIAAWTLDALADAAQANALLRARLGAAIAKLESERDILRDSLMDFDGNFASAGDKRILDGFDREIAAGRAALARTSTRTKDKEAS